MSLDKLSLTEVKKFIGVKFVGYGESNDTIPKQWVFVWSVGSKKVLWPPKNAAFLAKRKSEPENDWHLYDVIPL